MASSSAADNVSHGPDLGFWILDLAVLFTALKIRAVFEFLIARIYFRARQCAEAVDSELLAAEAAHHRPVDHGAAQFIMGDISVPRVYSLAGEVADKTAGETIARACGI